MDLPRSRLTLTGKQFRRLLALAEAPGKCVSYEALYQAIWPDGTAFTLASYGNFCYHLV